MTKVNNDLVESDKNDGWVSWEIGQLFIWLSKLFHGGLFYWFKASWASSVVLKEFHIYLCKNLEMTMRDIGKPWKAPAIIPIHASPPIHTTYWPHRRGEYIVYCKIYSSSFLRLSLYKHIKCCLIITWYMIHWMSIIVWQLSNLRSIREGVTERNIFSFGHKWPIL